MSRFTLFDVLTVVIVLLVAGCSPSPKMPADNQIAHVTPGRRLSDIKLTAVLTEAQVAAVWGPPDGHRGSGIDYISYTVEDNQEVWMQFSYNPPYPLLGAILWSRSTGQSKVLFSQIDRAQW